MHVITYDFETYYDRAFSLSKMTTEEYIRDELFEVIGVSVQVDDGEPQWFSGTKAQTKKWLEQFPWDNAIAVAHNAMFDAAILNWHFDIRPKRIADTLSMLRALDGPDVGNSLAKAAERYGLGVKGNEVVNALGKGRIDFTPEELDRYGKYCKNDTALTYDLFKELCQRLPLFEMKLIDLTIRMFTEPVLELDKDILTAHLNDVKEKKEKLLSKALIDKDNLMSNPKLAETLRSLGVEPPMKISPTTGKETYAFAKNDEPFKALLEHESVLVQAIVAARLGVKSTLEETRTERFIGVADRGTLPIPLRYYAAHTGRWGGDDKVNMQNLPRKSPLKKAIKAPDGYTFIDCDSSQIEARTLAWLAGQDDLVAAFDAGEDVYKIMASSIYNVPIEEVTDAQRFVGKTTILGAGYGMGAVKFQAQLKTFGVELPLDECKYIIAVYRQTYPMIPLLWKQGQSAIKAMINQNTTGFGREGVVTVNLMGIRLPNNLYLKYPNLRAHHDPKTGSTEYLYDQKKGRAVIPTRIYGGKCLAANTEVLTERGWVPIVQVTISDRVWDGIDWVSHDGLTYQGKKSTTVLNGVRMTPDHEVLTEKGWLHASSCEGLHRADFWMPDGSEVRGDEWEAFYVGVPLRLREGSNTHCVGCGEIRASGRNPLMRLYGWGEEQVARYVEASRIRRMAVDEGSLSATNTPSMAQLRRTGYYGMSKMEGFVRGLLGGYGAYVYAGAYARPEGQQRGLHTGELPLGHAGSAGAEHAFRATRGPEEGSRADEYPTFDAPVPMAPEPVYDLLNAGPRSRFVVRGSSGPFVVHNCVENVCQALARIVIGEQMLMIARRQRVVMTVHDAVGSIVPTHEAEAGRAFVEQCMRIRPKWALGLPLNCESKMGASYGG